VIARSKKQQTPVNMKSTVLAPLAAAIFGAAGVSAHGYVDRAILDGTQYTGYLPYQGQKSSRETKGVLNANVKHCHRSVL
jgi:predicted carbohydrate-binding protein with CBM5 and CBM33 domain